MHIILAGWIRPAPLAGQKKQLRDTPLKQPFGRIVEHNLPSARLSKRGTVEVCQYDRQ
jgi:hypothetical protein